MNIEYITPNIEDKQDEKPRTQANEGFPYTQLHDRRFEELIYSLFKSEIDNNAFTGQFDEIHLMQGVRERGRDCALFHKRKNVGLIQCKNNKSSNLGKPEVAREIIKFALHYLNDNSLIQNINQFIYYLAISNKFAEPAADLIHNFNNQITNESQLHTWTEQVIRENSFLQNLEFSEIKEDLLKVLTSIEVKKILPQDIDEKLHKTNNQHLQDLFFEVKTVVDNREIKKLRQTIEKKLQYSQVLDISNDIILQKFNNTSFHLKNHQKTFEGINNSTINRNETNKLFNWLKRPIYDPKEKPIAILAGNAGSGKSVILVV